MSDTATDPKALLAAIDGADDGTTPPPHGGRETQADLLVRLAKEGEAALFHGPDGTAYATVPVAAHHETHAVRRHGFRDWLVRRFYQTTNKAPNAEAISNALGVLDTCARFDGDCYSVALRVAGTSEAIYLDLGTDDWSVVEVTALGWRIIPRPPVGIYFRRARGMLPLPVPTHGGSIEDVKIFWNVEELVLPISWLTAAARPRGPYPVLVIQGEQGSAKSTLARTAKALLDPSTAPLRTRPRDERDLYIAATHGHILAFDNISELPDWLSDALCRLATGGGFATRALYTDEDEVLFEAQRPVILNGITDLATRDDLRDRAVVLTLPPLADTERKDEAALWLEFASAQPAILGAVLDGVSTALANMLTTELPSPPRMADFALWAVAASPSFGWTAERFLEAYTGNRRDAVAMVLEASVVAQAVQRLVATREWTGTAAELLAVLDAQEPDHIRKRREWPGSPRGLSDALRRLAPAFRVDGVLLDRDREAHTGRRIIRLEKRGQTASPSSPSPASPSSPVRHPQAAPQVTLGLEVPDSGDAGDAGDADLRTLAAQGDDPDAVARAAMREGA